MFPKRLATACGAYCLRRVLRLTALRGRRERPYCLRRVLPAARTACGAYCA